MADCNNTKVFFEEAHRMSKACNGNYSESCTVCPIGPVCNIFEFSQKQWREDAIDCVQKWSDLHPLHEKQNNKTTHFAGFNEELLRRPDACTLEPDAQNTKQLNYIIRPCEVMNTDDTVMFNGVFHGFYVISEIIPPSPLRGGHAGGVESQVAALVEDLNGQCKMVHPNRIRFTDRIAIMLSEDKNGGKNEK